MNLEQLLEVALHNCRLVLHEPLLVGVSGGPDSLCLLDALARLRFPVIAAHFDHGLRPESTLDADVVRQQAARLGVPFVTERQEVAVYARQAHLSIEAAARELRYQFLFNQARRVSAQAVAVGHTADDQVETVLMHLLRGSGLAGLTGMAFRSVLPAWEAKIPLVRPLLPFSRTETLSYCQEHALQPVFDPTNQDPAFLRNRLRHELIPLLETYNPQMCQAIWRMAQLLSDDNALLQKAEQEAWESCIARQEQAAVGLQHAAFLGLAPGLQRRVLRRAVLQIQPIEAQLHDLDYAAIARALRWAAAPGSGKIDLLQGLYLFVEGDLLWIARDQGPSMPADWPQLAVPSLPLPVPGSVALSSSWWLSSAVLEDWKTAGEGPPFDADPSSAWTAWLDADAIPGPLAVRRVHPGDRFRPLGMQGHSLKLSDFWVNEKLPRRARQSWPLVVSGEEVVWVPGFRLAHPYRVREQTRRVLVLRLERD